jgi:hypothetical protein
MLRLGDGHEICTGAHGVPLACNAPGSEHNDTNVETTSGVLLMDRETKKRKRDVGYLLVRLGSVHVGVHCGAIERRVVMREPRLEKKG